jgi:hypothetical protein
MVAVTRRNFISAPEQQGLVLIKVGDEIEVDRAILAETRVLVRKNGRWIELRPPHPHRDIPGDPSGYWNDMRMIDELKKDGGDLSLRAAAAIAWLRNEMIDPGEYMRVSNERGRLMGEINYLKARAVQ